MRKEVVRKRKKGIKKGAILLLAAFVVSAVVLVLIILSFFKEDAVMPEGSEIEGDVSSSALSSQTDSLQSLSKASYASEISQSFEATSTQSTHRGDLRKPSYSESSPAKATDDLGKWNLMLVNPQNKLDEGYTPPLSKVKYASRNDAQFDSRAISALNTMCSDAAKSGVNIYSISAYRTISTQTRLYNNEVAKQKGYGLSEEKAQKVAATVVAYPGTSEHNLGLAVDFNSVEESFENTAQYRWLRQNAENYGFVMRYPKEKQNITGIIYEPWHYRYVGIVHAKKMNELNMCLEEYIAYLENSK